MMVHVGTSGFAYKEWRGAFYPEKIAPEEMLGFYAGKLGTVEINNTFYRMPAAHVLLAWAEHVPARFLFAFKAPQVITHFKRLRDVREEVRYLFKNLAVLGERLGPVLFQFPGSFHADPEALEKFLPLLPAEAACAFEFRHESWQGEETLSLLRGNGRALCLADTDENQVAEIVGTAPWGYLRLRRSDYPDADLSAWADRILSQKWKQAFVFIKHEDGARGPAMAMRLQEFADAGRKKPGRGR
jgi:uncharacterized protein YecE (DUF72 family)